MKTVLFVGQRAILESFSALNSQFRNYGFRVSEATNPTTAEKILKNEVVNVMIVHGFGDLFCNWIDLQSALPPTIYRYIEGVDKIPQKSGVKLISSNQTDRIVDIAFGLLCSKTTLILGLKPAVPTDPLEVALANCSIKPVRVDCFEQAVKIIKKQPIKALIIYADGEKYIQQIEEYPNQLPWVIYIKESGFQKKIERSKVVLFTTNVTPQSVIDTISDLPN